MKLTQQTSFAERHLEPADRIAEVLCGLIMVLTFTLTTRLTAGSGRAAVHRLLIAALGCNVAWGIIDGVLYVLSCLSQRASTARLVEAVQSATDPEAATGVIREALESRLLASARVDHAGDKESLVASLRSALSRATMQPVRVTRDDLLGGVAIFWLDLLACLPATLPFLIFREDHQRALRWSDGILIVLLFVAGERWGRFTGTGKLRAGFLMAGLGLAMVGVAALLGG